MRIYMRFVFTMLVGFFALSTVAATEAGTISFKATATLFQPYGTIPSGDTLTVLFSIDDATGLAISTQVSHATKGSLSSTSTPLETNVFNDAFGGTIDAIAIGGGPNPVGTLGGIAPGSAIVNHIIIDLRGDTSVLTSTNTPTNVATWNAFTQRTLALPAPSNPNATTGVATIGNFVVNTLIVTNTNDSGAGSLREAITAANGDNVATTITFDPTVFPLPPALSGVIVPLSALPNLIGPGDTIDGTRAGVILDGTNMTALLAAGLRVRASNYTIQGLSFRNFSANDAIVVEGRNATPVVTGVMIAGNTFNNNFRAVRIDGGNQNSNTTVNASVIGNTLLDNFRGIIVLGNVTGSDGGNSVSAFIDSNTIRGAQIEPLEGGDGIGIIGARDIGSGNSVIATVSNNTLQDIPDDGILAIGCSGGDTGSFNRVEATITGNVIKYKNNNSPPNFVNQGIIVSGAGGESDAISGCTDNTIVFEVSNNDVDGFKNNNISVSGGDEGTARNNVQGTIVGNTATNSRGNPGGTNLGGSGISVSAGSGTQHFVHDITITGNKVSGNPRRGISITGGSGTDSDVARITVSSNTVDGKPPKSPQYSITPELDQDGIFVTGGTDALNAALSEISIDGNITKNNMRGGVRVSQGDVTNVVLLFDITNNIATENSEDGISVRVGVPGLGVTPVSGNQCNNNGQDGIDINSPGYSLSNNSCSRNMGDGINAVVGNTNGGGNSGRRNGACNQPDFCFNTPLP
jgi:hypothetical protein